VGVYSQEYGYVDGIGMRGSEVYVRTLNSIIRLQKGGCELLVLCLVPSGTDATKFEVKRMMMGMESKFRVSAFVT